MSRLALPQSYEGWKYCIEVLCKQPLTAEFVRTRWEQLQDPGSAGNRRFVELYGLEHFQRVRGWFDQARRALAGEASA